MKYIQRLATLICMLTLSLGVMVSCEEEPEIPDKPDNPENPDQPGGQKNPVLAVELLSTDQASATMKVVSKDLEKFAYVVTSEAKVYSDPKAVFTDGASQDCSAEGSDKIIVGDLEFNTAYTVYFAGLVEKDEYFKEIVKVEFKTKDFEEDLTFYDIRQDSFKMRVKMPKLQNPDNVIKWGVTDLVTYNMNKPGMMGPMSDAEMLCLNDEFYHNYFRNDTTFLISTEESYIKDENGNLVDDGMDGYLTYYSAIVPGQPNVVFFGEFAYAPEGHWGWEPGYYNPLFDQQAWFLEATNEGYENVDEESYWKGYYSKSYVNNLPPAKMDAKLNISADVKPNGGVIRVQPDDAVMQYCICVLDAGVYDQLMPFLNDDPSLMQWYITTMNAVYNVGARLGVGDMEFTMDDFFYELYPGVDYYVFVTGMSDDTATEQCFETYKFTLPEATKPAPKVEVTPIENPNGPSSYQVWFNVKCPTGDVETAKYVANYAQDFDAILDQMDYNAIVDAYGAPFGAADIKKINSAEGLDVNFSAYPRSTTRLVVAGINDEGTAEDIMAEGTKAWADNTTEPIDDSKRIESPLFQQLKGIWTATTTVMSRGEFNPDTGDYEYHNQEMKCKVVIGESTCPNTLPEDVYAIYEKAGMSRKDITALYEDFKKENQLFNEEVRNQNRLLCLGFDFAEDQYGNQIPSATPYELFKMESYNAISNAAIFCDFGQKWYIEIDKDGNLTAPMNKECLYPMAAWNYYNPCYLGGINTAGENGASMIVGPKRPGDEWPAFDIALSEDKQYMTIRALDAHYPNAIYMEGAQAFVLKNTVVKEVTLSRGWTAPEQAPAANLSRFVVNDNVVYGRPRSRASFSNMPEVVNYKKASLKMVTVDEFRQNVQNYVKMIKNVK